MKTTLYLGTDPVHFIAQGHCSGNVIHYPVIKIVPRPLDHPDIVEAYRHLDEYTHIIFTSKNAVDVFFQHKTKESLQDKKIIAIGSVTASHLRIRGVVVYRTAEVESQEGVILLLSQIDLKGAYFFLPRSSLSRPALRAFFQENTIPFEAADLYDTIPQQPGSPPDLETIDEIVFTSPSTVDAFVNIFGSLPKNKCLISIGPITQNKIDQLQGVFQ